MADTILEKINRDVAFSRARHDYQHAFDALKSAGQLVFTANGAAALALLSFITSLVEENSEPIGNQIYLIASSLVFAVGASIATFALIKIFESKPNLDTLGKIWEFKRNWI